MLGGHATVSADTTGSDHQAVQAWPIYLGTSGGNIFDRSSIYCCSGTLGSLVKDAQGNQYILSNNHVLARFNQGETGEDVNQPGQIDQPCAQDGVVAHLSDFVTIQTSKGRSIKYNVVDAAIASVDPGAVRADGSILDIGPVNSTIVVNAAIGQLVKKSARTTGLTHGQILAIDVTVGVGYSKSCGGAANQAAYFENQIRIGSGSFSAGGDSGALIVEDVGSLPKPIGLLFAGSSSSTLANPIGAVLSQLGVQMASGTPPPPPDTGSISGTVTQTVGGAAIAGASVSVDTGQSTTTNGSGVYTLSSVPVGSRTVTASATGFVSEAKGANVVKDATTTADFALDVAVEPAMVQVACVTLNAEGGRFNDKHALFSVRAVDDFGNAVAGATVNIEVYRDGAFYGSGTGALSNSNGNVTYTSKNAPNGLYEITDVTISASGLTYVDSVPANSFDKGNQAGPVSECNAEFTSGSSTEALPQEISRARAAKSRSSQHLMGLPGVVGHGIGLSDDGHPVIEVYLANENASARAQIPNNIENFAVRVVVTGTFEAY